MLTWSYDPRAGSGAAWLWEVTKPEPFQTFKHDGPVYGAQSNIDGSRVLTWSDDKTARLWDVTKPEPLQTFKHDGSVNGAQFSRDESRVLTWSGNNTALWDVDGPLAMLTPDERILELEVRSVTTLDENLNLRVLKYDEWQAKIHSAEYRDLAARLEQAARDRAAGKPVAQQAVTVEPADAESGSMAAQKAEAADSKNTAPPTAPATAVSPTEPLSAMSRTLLAALAGYAVLVGVTSLLQRPQH